MLEAAVFEPTSEAPDALAEAAAHDEQMVPRAFLGRIALEQGVWGQSPDEMSADDVAAHFEEIDRWLERGREHPERLPFRAKGFEAAIGLLHLLRNGVSGVSIVNQALEQETTTEEAARRGYGQRLGRLHKLLRIVREDFTSSQGQEAGGGPQSSSGKSRTKSPNLSRPDLRIKAASQAGWSSHQIAEAFNMSEIYVRRLMQSAPRHRRKPSIRNPRSQATNILKADEEVMLAKRIEAGLFAEHLLQQVRAEGRQRVTCGSTEATAEELQIIAREGREAVARFLTMNRGLVASVLLKMSWAFTVCGLPQNRDTMRDIIDEVVADDKKGLFHAVMKYDFTHGVKFSTYAMHWVRLGLDEAFGARHPYAFSNPAQYFNALILLRKAHREAKSTPPSQRTPEQIAILTNEDPRLATTALGLGQNVGIYTYVRTVFEAGSMVSPDATQLPSGDNGNSFWDKIIPINAPTPETVVTEKLGRPEVIDDALLVLSAREKRIMRDFFGLAGQEPLTSEQICERYGWLKKDEERWRRAALAKLRSRKPHLLEQYF